MIGNEFKWKRVDEENIVDFYNFLVEDIKKTEDREAGPVDVLVATAMIQTKLLIEIRNLIEKIDKRDEAFYREETSTDFDSDFENTEIRFAGDINYDQNRDS